MTVAPWRTSRRSTVGAAGGVGWAEAAIRLERRSRGSASCARWWIWVWHMQPIISWGRTPVLRQAGAPAGWGSGVGGWGGARGDRGVAQAADYVVGQDSSPAAGVHVGVFVLG